MARRGVVLKRQGVSYKDSLTAPQQGHTGPVESVQRLMSWRFVSPHPGTSIWDF